ncbi:MAG TPA: hypothetical protein VGI21_21525 [Streptosporangiaceae bacterium]|jgi:hypothetical protein
MTKDYADLAVVQQHAASGGAPLSAAPQGIGAFGLPVSWLMGAVGSKRPRNADLGLIQAKCAVDTVAPITAQPGDTTVHSTYKYMTRIVANSDSGSGSHPPLRERPPA